MTTAADLDRLQALLTRLGPVAARQRGELIRADDWNLVVGSLIELARAVLAEAASAVVPAHDHTDQVQLSWLDGRLRGLLQNGPLSDPANLGRLQAVERQLAGSGGNLDSVKADLDGLRDRVAQVTTRDLVREADVTTVRRTVAALGDSRSDILGLRETMAAIRTDLNRAIEVGQQLEVDGHPVDVPGLVAKVAALEALEQHLTLPDGRPLDAAELERRLTELTNTLVTEQELDAALAGFHPTIPADVIDGVKSDVLALSLGQINPKIDQLRADTNTTIDKRLSDLDGRIGTAVVAALPQVRDQVLAAAQERIDAAVAHEDADVRSLLDQRLAEQKAGLESELGSKIDGVSASILPTARDETARQLDDKLPPISAATAVLDARSTGLETRVSAAEQRDGTQDAAIGQLRADVTGLSARIDREVPAAIATADQHASALVDSAAAQLKTDLATYCDNQIAQKLGEVINQLRGEMHEIAKDEIAAVRAEAMKFVDGRIAERFARLPEDVLAIFKADFAQKGPLYALITGATGTPNVAGGGPG